MINTNEIRCENIQRYFWLKIERKPQWKNALHRRSWMAIKAYRIDFEFACRPYKGDKKGAADARFRTELHPNRRQVYMHVKILRAYKYDCINYSDAYKTKAARRAHAAETKNDDHAIRKNAETYAIISTVVIKNCTPHVFCGDDCGQGVKNFLSIFFCWTTPP